MSADPSLKVYCSGPLFSPEEVGAMQAIADQLEKKGMATFLPHRDGLESWLMPLSGMPLQDMVPGVRRRVDQAIFALDVYQLLEECDAIVVNLNGRVPDEGALVEASIAWATGLPVVYYKHDHRAPFGGYDNAMVTGLTRGRSVDSVRRIPAAVRKACAGHEVSPREPNAELERTLRAGRRIAQIVRHLPTAPGPGHAVLDKVLEVVDSVQP
jgi:nucleoside 2-deoxyribosyltransferase